MEIEYRVSKKINIDENDEVVVFCVVGNERYFLPHFLEHYRSLGIEKFNFLVDHSTDGTSEYLQAQDDCAVFLTDSPFSRRVNINYQGKKYGQSTGTFWKTLIPRRHLQDKWVLVVDADEFLQLPNEFKKIQDLTAKLEKNNLNSCRALMIDFFPEFLSDIKKYDDNDSPFIINPFFDPIDIVWEDRTVQPKLINTENNVRNRIVDKIMLENPAEADMIKNQKVKWQFKTPLLKFSQSTFHIDAHRSSHRPSADVQCVLAHFKFQPNWQKRVDWAIKSKSYYLGSLKYQPLRFAKDHLQDWSLISSSSIKFEGREDLEKNNLIFSNLN